ncbi:MAG TPA: NUDIX pyrophosphatase [Ignavibacteria bacterium]|nr:NUDIX pyrophosphatase [Ignavibacteria bacterium]
MAKVEIKYVEVYVIRKFPNNETRFLVLKRSDNSKKLPGKWQVVTGKIDGNEKAYEAALRELKEETGLSPIYFASLQNVTTVYDHNEDSVLAIPLFLAETDSDNVQLSNEHSEFAWLSFERAAGRVHWLNQGENIIKANDFLNDPDLFSTLEEIKL